MQTYDLIVIGGGPGGYVAAIKAAQLGLKVALVEKGQVGGTCLNRGCIPTKAILESAKLFQKIKTASKFGIKVADPTVDYAAVIKHKNQIVTKLIKGVEFLLKKNGVELMRGVGKILERGRVEVTNEKQKSVLECRNIILATGSEPALIKNFNIDEKNILTSTAFLNLATLPESVLIIGGGVMGVEFASILASFGVKVTIIEALERILPVEDQDISKTLEGLLKKKGVEIVCGIHLEEIKSETGVVARLADGTTYQAEKALITIGRKPNIEGLESIGIKLVDGSVEINEKMETSIPGIYSIGDITGKYLLAHLASAQGKIAAQACAGQEAKINYDAVPWCIFSIPEIGRVGLTELAAKRAGLKVKTVNFPYRALGRAKTLEAEDGFIKIITDEQNQKIVGVHIIGSNASELVATAGLAMSAGLTPEAVAQAIYSHPTLAEGLGEACEALFGQAIHF